MRPVAVAVVTPAAVEPLATSPAGPLPAAPDVRTSHWYPLEGFDGDAVQLNPAVVGVTEVILNPDGATQAGTSSKTTSSNAWSQKLFPKFDIDLKRTKTV